MRATAIKGTFGAVIALLFVATATPFAQAFLIESIDPVDIQGDQEVGSEQTTDRGGGHMGGGGGHSVGVSMGGGGHSVGRPTGGGSHSVSRSTGGHANVKGHSHGTGKGVRYPHTWVPKSGKPTGEPTIGINQKSGISSSVSTSHLKRDIARLKMGTNYWWNPFPDIPVGDPPPGPRRLASTPGPLEKAEKAVEAAKKAAKDKADKDKINGDRDKDKDKQQAEKDKQQAEKDKQQAEKDKASRNPGVLPPVVSGPEEEEEPAAPGPSYYPTSYPRPARVAAATPEPEAGACGAGVCDVVKEKLAEITELMTRLKEMKARQSAEETMSPQMLLLYGKSSEKLKAVREFAQDCGEKIPRMITELEEILMQLEAS